MSKLNGRAKPFVPSIRQLRRKERPSGGDSILIGWRRLASARPASSAAEELDFWIVGGWPGQQLACSVEIAQVQIEERSDVSAFGCDGPAGLNGADHLSDTLACESVGVDPSGQQLADEFFEVGVGVVLGVPHCQEQPPAP